MFQWKLHFSLVFCNNRDMIFQKINPDILGIFKSPIMSTKVMPDAMSAW